MKTAALIIGVLLMILSGIGFLICFILPGVTRNVSVQEAMLVAVPLGILCFLSFVMTIVSAILVIKARKNTAGQQQMTGQQFRN